MSHADIVRRSFAQQTALFTGPDAIFARRPQSPEAWLEPLDADMIVLDVACGAAHVAEGVAPRVRQVVAVDITPTLLALGAERLRANGVDNVLLVGGDATALTMVDDSFDVVACRSSLHHFPDPEQLVREMTRVCRPGGRVVIADMIAPAAESRAAFDDLHRTIDPSHARALLEPELAELVARIAGPVTYGETTRTGSIPIELVLTEAADRDAALATLRRELDGGPATGFAPVVDRDSIAVSFASTTVHATIA